MKIRIARDGIELGEFDFDHYDHILCLIADGQIALTDHYWLPGMEGWGLLSDIIETPPPPKPSIAPLPPTNYYYRNMYGIESGPVTSLELAKLIREGIVYASRPVRRADSSEWILAKDLPQFAELRSSGTFGRVVTIICAVLIVIYVLNKFGLI